MEPITYANGSTLEDPAITYGIVFSNFMSKGVFTFQGGTDRLIKLMHEELLAQRRRRAHQAATSRRSWSSDGRVDGVRGQRPRRSAPGGRLERQSQGDDLQPGRAKSISIASFVDEAQAVRLNNSSCQVYMALKPGVELDESLGDLLFSSTAPLFRTELLLSRDVTSRTYSFYYPRTRPGSDRSLIVSSTNANYEDWADLSPEDYEASKHDLVETTLDALAKYVPDIRDKLDHAEASTPLTFRHYTQASRGRQLRHQVRGLAVSRAIPEQIAGLYHAGSVGIIMSGWLGAMNYGVIVANDVDSLADENRLANRSLRSRLHS